MSGHSQTGGPTLVNLPPKGKRDQTSFEHENIFLACLAHALVAALVLVISGSIPLKLSPRGTRSGPFRRIECNPNEGYLDGDEVVTQPAASATTDIHEVKKESI